MIFVARRMRPKALPRFPVESSRLSGAVLSERGILGNFLEVRHIRSSTAATHRV